MYNLYLININNINKFSLILTHTFLLSLNLNTMYACSLPLHTSTLFSLYIRYLVI